MVLFWNTCIYLVLYILVTNISLYENISILWYQSSWHLVFWRNTRYTRMQVVSGKILWPLSFIHSNAPVPCHVLLQGSPLGFDITPFAQQLLRLGGRRGPFVLRPSPLNPGMRSIMQVRGPGLDRDMFMAPINPGRVIPTGRRRRRKLY